MSRRASSRATTRTSRRGKPETSSCLCGNPTRDGLFVCDGCLDRLAKDLRSLLPAAGDRPEMLRKVHYRIVRRPIVGDVWCPWPMMLEDVGIMWCPWPRPREDEPGLWASLQSAIAGERGIDYRALGGGTGGSGATGLTLNEAGVHAATRLRKALRQLVITCMAAHVDHTAPADWAPRAAAEVPAMAEWLSWRVSGLATHPEVARHPKTIHDAIEAARRIVMPAPRHQQLGDCLVDGCDGHMTAEVEDDFATCDKCGSWVETQPLRDWLIDELEHRLVTAAEAANLSTYLALRFDREAVRKRVNLWAHRGRLIDPRVIEWTPGLCPWPAPAELRFRFGDVYDLLLLHEAHREEATP